MENIGALAATYVPWVVGLAVLAIVLKFFSSFLLQLFGIIMVPSNRVAVVTKKFVILNKAKTLPDGHIIALQGEPGTQADTLAPGLYFGYWAWQFEIEMVEMTTIDEGMVGIVEAVDGNSIMPGRIFAHRVECDAYQNARAFFANGGQRGPQIEVMRPGSYRVNTRQFKVTIVRALEVPQNRVGIVTMNDGAPLGTGEIAGVIVPGHNKFQDGQAFIDAGGNRGLQEEVILEGRYYIHPQLVNVELAEMVNVNIGYAGVVVSFVGKQAAALPPATPGAAPGARHGRIVEVGEKGVWREPLDPGRYPLNVRTCRIEMVPTTNTVLNWAEAKSEAHNLDAKLSTIAVRSKDGFAFNIDVAQIIHIGRDNASEVIARFGSVQNLVTQVLEPLIGNYFRNSAQSSDVIDFLTNRSERQAEAKQKIQEAISGHRVEAVDTLIGDINPPAELMKTLTDMKVAEREAQTYAAQRQAQDARTNLMQATAEADTRGQVVSASRAVEVAELDASATVKRAEGQKQATILGAQAEAERLTLTGNAEAGKIKAIGEAEAGVQRQKVESIGAAAYAAIQIGTKFAENKIALVPEINVSGGGAGEGRGIVDAFLGNVLKGELDGRNGKLNGDTAPPPAAPAPAPAAPETSS